MAIYVLPQSEAEMCADDLRMLQEMLLAMAGGDQSCYVDRMQRLHSPVFASVVLTAMLARHADKDAVLHDLSMMDMIVTLNREISI